MARNRQNHFHDETNPAGAAWGLLPVIGSPRACHTFFNYTRDWPAKYEECFSMSSDGKRLGQSAPSGRGRCAFPIRRPAASSPAGCGSTSKRTGELPL